MQPKTAPNMQAINQTRSAMQNAGWVLADQELPGIYIQGSHASTPPVDRRVISQELMDLLEDISESEVR
jgi:hypothetical protein